MSPSLSERVSALDEAQRRELRDALARHSDARAAIVGIGMRLPGASDLDAFWAMLKSSETAIREVPASRWNSRPDEARGIGHGGFLDDIVGFDREAFTIAERELAAVDPQQRLALEVTVEALDDAGLPKSTLKGANVGVFFGASTNDHARQMLGQPELSSFSSLGGALSSIASRIAFELDLHGPALVTDCACASSMASLHLACSALERHEIDVAIVGGVNVILDADVGRSLFQTGMLSPTGRCRPFDAQADGFVRGEGAAVLVLKRLGDAMSDRDGIHAVVRGSAIYQDGRSNGFLAPNPTAQAQVIARALEVAGAASDDIEVLEASGTGTPFGDRLEARAISVAFSGRTRALTVSSLKGAIGHLEAASGLAAVVKACLMLRHRLVPKPAGQQDIAPAVQSDPRLLFVEEAAGRAISPAGLVGVSAFGFGGTNCHVVLAGAPHAPAPRLVAPPSRVPILLSARSEGALKRLASHLARWLASKPKDVSLADVAHTLAVRREHFSHRAACMADDIDSLRRWLLDLNDRPARPMDGVDPDLQDLARAADASGIAARAPEVLSDWQRGRLSARSPSDLGAAPADELTCRLYEAGFDCDWTFAAPDGVLARLPPYPWDRPGTNLDSTDLVPANLPSHPPTREARPSGLHLFEVTWRALGRSADAAAQTSRQARQGVFGAAADGRLLRNLLGALGPAAQLLDRPHQALGFDRIILAYESNGLGTWAVQAAHGLDLVNQTVEILAGNRGSAPPELIILTARKGLDDGQLALRRGLEGFVRCAPFDVPDVRCRWVDLEEATPEAIHAGLTLATSSADDEDVIRMVGPDAFVPRLQPQDETSRGWISDPADHAGTVVVAGAGFVGQRLALRALLSGARALVVISQGEGARELSARLQAQFPGRMIRWTQSDLADEAQVRVALGTATQDLPPISSAYLCIRPATDGGLQALSSIDGSCAFERTAGSACMLHAVLPASARLVVLGSTVSLLGAPESGLSAVVEAAWSGACEVRRAAGGRAAFIAWGPWADDDVSDGSGAASMINLAPPGLAAELSLAAPTAGEEQFAALAFDLSSLLRSFPRAADASLVREIVLGSGLRQAPSRSYTRPELSVAFAEPDTDIEANIAASWRRALSIDRVGVADDFFELGGDSIVGGTIIDEVNRTYGISMTTENAFPAFTVRQMASFVEAALAERVADLSEEELDRLLAADARAE
jgi:3-oxoacyl-(acyl-carrier-protein) synthase